LLRLRQFGHHREADAELLNGSAAKIQTSEPRRFGMARAVRAPNWTELWIVLDEGIRTTASTLASTSGRTLLPDGREVTVRLQKVNVNLLANVRDTGRLWVLGTPKAGYPARIGLPGYPLLGTAKLGKR
jgi:hypothetical protein